jgi:transcriptional regulator with XRE-family HTH domain
MSRFGDLVKRLRKDRSMTLEQVARKIQSHKGYVSGIENGKVNPPSVKFIRKFARIFQFDEKQMVRLAYVDKAPKLIRDEAQVILDAAGSNGSAAASAGVPLLNTVATGYPVDLDPGDPALVDASLVCRLSASSPAATSRSATTPWNPPRGSASPRATSSSWRPSPS